MCAVDSGMVAMAMGMIAAAAVQDTLGRENAGTAKMEPSPSFQADASIGIFGGEFRLAKYFDGKETKIINNGAFSANIMEKGLNMYFSKEMIHIDNYYGPKYILIKDVNIG